MIIAMITNISMRMRMIIIICKAVESSHSDGMGRAVGLMLGRPGFESWLSHILVV